MLDFDREVRADETYAQKLQVLNDAYTKLDPRLVAEATAIIEPYINKQRLERVTSVLQQRTKNVKFLFENPSNPSNVWACLRTIDSFGIQNVDVIINSKMYEGKQAITQKRGMRTAMGSAQWLTLTNHPTTYDAIQTIRNLQGYKIYASDLNPNSQDIRNIQWNDTDNNSDTKDSTKSINGGNSDRPICIVMGNEDRGISDEMRELADETFTLPMYGVSISPPCSLLLLIIDCRAPSSSLFCQNLIFPPPPPPARLIFFLLFIYVNNFIYILVCGIF